MPNTWIELNKQNLLDNLQQFKNIAPGAEIWPVVKSNAYGHGVLQIVKILNQDQNVSGFMTVNLSEARDLSAWTDKPIMVLSYFDHQEDDLKLALAKNISLPIYDLETVDYLNNLAAKYNKKFLVNIKIDTGTNRLGFRIEETLETIKYVQNKPWLDIFSLYTHFAESESEDLDFSYQQLSALKKISADFPKIKIHSACTAASLALVDNGDIIRLGVGLYGLWPSQAAKERGQKLGLDLKPVLSWRAKLISVKNIKAGQTIGYNRTYQCPEDCQIGVVPVGYYEGYDRRLSNKAEVLIRGKRYPVRGNICMNLSMIELPKDLGIKAGEIVTMIGADGDQYIGVDDLAKACSTINYEIICKINYNILRHITDVSTNQDK